MISTGMLLINALTSLSTILSAQTSKVQGIIKERSGAAIILQTSDSPNLVVLLTDFTDVGQIQGVLKARRKSMSMAALIPGLPIQVEGTYDGQHRLEAKSVKFKGDDLEQAKAIQAGLHETQVRARQNSADLGNQKATLQQQQEQLAIEQQKIASNKAELTAQQQTIASNKAAIEAAIARFGQLDDYYILNEVTVYFGNGKVDIEPKYKSELLQLAEKAKKIQAYMIEIKGYASSAGSTAVNQRISEDRANNVANFLIQQGHIALTNLLAPGAMGESQQVGNDKTVEAEAENRRVVVRVLQNKGIAGL